MAEDLDKEPKVLKFLNDYRKQLSQLKTKAFYAYHLCKAKCLIGKLDQDPSECFTNCDNWLDRYFAIKKQKNPDAQQQILVSSQEIPQDKRQQYQKSCALAKIQIKEYIKGLSQYVDNKIQDCKI